MTDAISRSSHLLITGATGKLGRRLLPKFIGYPNVSCLVRNIPQDPKFFHESVKIIQGDVENYASVEGAVRGAECVLHIAARNEGESWDDFHRVNVIGTRNILAACEKSGVRRLIYISSVAALYEDNHYTKSKMATENLVLASPIKTIILRPSLVYHADHGIVKFLKVVRALPIIVLPRKILMHRLEQPVFIDTVVDTIQRAVHSDQFKPGKAYFLVGSNRETVAELIDKITIYPFKPLKLGLPSPSMASWDVRSKGGNTPELLYDPSDSITDFGFTPPDIKDVMAQW